jgi:hypothetical protein
MKPQPPLTKAEMIERSMSCFVLGLIGLAPVVGIPMAVMALAHYRRVELGRGAMWNPAQNYLVWGYSCAWIGIVLTLILGSLVGSLTYLWFPWTH